jgi:hypothetical protein
MQKTIKILVLLALAGFIGTHNKALASYYNGDEFQVMKTTVGFMAGTAAESCKIPKGSITTVVAPLQRYNMLAVKSSNACIALIPLELH